MTLLKKPSKIKNILRSPSVHLVLESSTSGPQYWPNWFIVRVSACLQNSPKYNKYFCLALMMAFVWVDIANTLSVLKRVYLWLCPSQIFFLLKCVLYWTALLILYLMRSSYSTPKQHFNIDQNPSLLFWSSRLPTLFQSNTRNVVVYCYICYDMITHNLFSTAIN